MVNYNYIIREDNVGKLISEDGMVDALDIEETLTNKYNYLYKSMIENHYKLNVNHCTFFKEIVFNKKVVGFAAYTIINSISNLSMVACYLLPKFRGKSLFFDEINSVFEEGKQISFYQPPRFIIELLIEYGFAKKITDNIAVSSINIDIPSNAISHKYKEDSNSNDYMFTSNVYDLDLCGYLILKNNNVNYLTDYFDEDDKKYSCKKNREMITDEYFEHVTSILKNNEHEINKFLKNIHKNYSTFSENIIETSPKIDFEDLINIHNENNITEELVEDFDKIESDKNTLLMNSSDINKKEYIESYKNVGIYDFIRLFNDNQNLDLTNSIIKIDYEFKSDYIKNSVLDEGYISNEVDVDAENKYLTSLKVNELKDILKENNLTVTGNKSALIKRILEYVPASTLIETEPKITRKGFKFMEEHDEIDFYNVFLKNFFYFEFKKFLSENEGNIFDVSKLFLKEHIKISIKKNDNKAYSDTLKALALIHELNNDYKKGLCYELKLFIVGLNAIFLDESLYNYYQPISKQNIDNIKTLLFKNKLDLKKEFEISWKNMEVKEFLVPYEKSLKILNQMISGEDRDYMNDKIREKYLRKENIIHDKLDKSIQSTLDQYF